MKIAVEGCAHGDLEKIYNVIHHLEEQENFKIDLLLCCGDFQATRNVHDLNSMAVPPKYREMCSFYKYYSGEKTAPVLTIFIGGNHEASNHLQELPYGGWVAPNIYYLGYAGVVSFGGVRIAGLSGIYKPNDFMMGRYEKPPYTEQSKRTVYHIRNLDVFRLKQLKEPVDICLSHDWPRGVHKYGNVSRLLRFKPHFREDIESNRLGSLPSEELLNLLKPKYWFSAHLHCKFSAIIPHDKEKNEWTKFLALDKCLPKRNFLQVLDVDHDSNKPLRLEYDAEWLAVLHFTNHLISFKRDTHILPNKDFARQNIRWDFTPTAVEMDFVRAKMSEDLVIPENFVRTAPAYVAGQPPAPSSQPSPNPQTQSFCQRLGISDMFEHVLGNDGNTDSQGRCSQGSPATPQFNSFVESDTGNVSSTSSSSSSSSSSDPEESQDTTRSSLSWDSDVSPLRGVLTLPPPKNNQQTLPSNSPPPTTPTSCAEKDGEECAFVIDTIPISTPVLHKKFKRRNQDMYREPEPDDSTS